MGDFPSTVKSDEQAIVFLGAQRSGSAKRLVTTSAATTLSPTYAQMQGGLIALTGGTTCTVTTPTAALILAGITAALVQVGSKFDFEISNQNSGTATLAGGTGVTLVGTATLATTKTGVYRGVVTNIGVGTEAVVIYCFPSA